MQLDANNVQWFFNVDSRKKKDFMNIQLFSEGTQKVGQNINGDIF